MKKTKKIIYWSLFGICAFMCLAFCVIKASKNAWIQMLGLRAWTKYELAINGTSVEEELQAQIEQYTNMLETAQTKEQREQIMGLIKETQKLLDIYSAFHIF